MARVAIKNKVPVMETDGRTVTQKSAPLPVAGVHATHPGTQTQINVPILNEDNHKEWKDAILLQLRLLELDYAVLNEEPPEVTEESTGEAKQLRAQWEKSNGLCVLFIKSRISRKIRFCFEDIKKAKPLLKAIDDNFIESKKVLAMTLIMKLRNLRLSTVKGTREHIMQLRDIVAQLKELEIILPDDYLVLFALDTLPQEYNPFKISYITHKEDWSINELITMCAMEEQRLVAKLGGSDRFKDQFLPSIILALNLLRHLVGLYLSAVLL
ncbi:PREDICTED: uncharacterized protein LOC109172486 [Ipomoea nil]|uniref:uncharacterized protein LOC109172486 n=1 Tax=Ipomoea nil TaxID=35883 RepID=UPI0009017F80|nr:PREDICTED: uncharacterized protein LOC109172486 [Ipomoea nil]